MSKRKLFPTGFRFGPQKFPSTNSSKKVHIEYHSIMIGLPPNFKPDPPTSKKEMAQNPTTNLFWSKLLFCCINLHTAFIADLQVCCS